MSKNAKIILIVIAAIVFICICTCVIALATVTISSIQLVRWADHNVTEDFGDAIRIGSEIADFEVPSGYNTPYGLHFGDITLVGYKTQNERSMLFLAQFPQGTSINLDEMLRLIQEGSGNPDSIWFSTQTTLLEQKSVRIRRQETTLNISEGISVEGTPYRAATATFQGRGGPAVVLIASPLDEWDIEAVEAFIASIQ
jgi:hypothetical protein